MRLFHAADVLLVTGLTRHQLRKWTGRGRRALLAADVEADGPGRHALYAWQTILVLRLLRVLHGDFAAEVGAWAPALRALRRRLDGVPFPALRDLCVVFPCREAADLAPAPVSANFSGVVLPLEPHLDVLATRLPLPGPAQLPLFPIRAVTR